MSRRRPLRSPAVKRRLYFVVRKKTSLAETVRPYEIRVMRYERRFSILPSTMGYPVYYPTRYGTRARSWRPFPHPARLSATHSA